MCVSWHDPSALLQWALMSVTHMTPASRPLACLSDIHGNLPALQAVLAELGRIGVADIFVAGDLLLGGDEPLEVWQRLQEVGARCTRGPADLALATVDPARLAASNPEEEAKLERFVQTRRALGDLVLARLRRLPERLRWPMIDGRELLMVHGSPKDPYTSIGHELEDAEILALLADDPADIVICGGSHVPFQRNVDDVDVVNVGSVGEAPEGRYAHYTVLSPKVTGAIIEQNYVTY